MLFSDNSSYLGALRQRGLFKDVFDKRHQRVKTTPALQRSVISSCGGLSTRKLKMTISMKRARQAGSNAPSFASIGPEVVEKFSFFSFTIANRKKLA